jgi:hypothetical protein
MLDTIETETVRRGQKQMVGYIVGLLAAFGLGMLTMAVMSVGSREEECGGCPEACAWGYVRAGLANKGWREITPELVVALAVPVNGSNGDGDAGDSAG